MEEQKPVTRKRYSRLILTEGKFADAKIRELFGLDSEFTGAMIREIYRNTLAEIRGGRPPIVKVSHWDPDPRNKGMMDRIRMVRAPLPSSRTGLGIEAGFWLNQPWADEYEQGLYPNASIEADNISVDDTGADIGWMLSGFAIFGNAQPAVSGLPRIYSAEGVEVHLSARSYEVLKVIHSQKRPPGKGRIAAAISALAGKGAVSAATVEEADLEELTTAANMIIEQTAAIRDGGDNYDASPNLDEIDKQCSLIMDWVEAKMAEGPSEEEAPPPAEAEAAAKTAASVKPNPADKAMQKRIAELEAANKLLLERAKAEDEKELKDVFASLQSAGAVVAQDWDEFCKTSAAIGLGRARDLYAAKANQRETPFSKLPKGVEPTPENLQLSELTERYKGFYSDPKEAEAAAKFALERGYTKAGTN